MQVAVKALYGFGMGVGFLIVGFVTWAFGRWAYAAMWRHRERAAIFEIEKQRAMAAAMENQRGEIPGGFVRHRVITSQTDRAGAGQLKKIRAQ